MILLIRHRRYTLAVFCVVVGKKRAIVHCNTIRYGCIHFDMPFKCIDHHEKAHPSGWLLIWAKLLEPVDSVHIKDKLRKQSIKKISCYNRSSLGWSASSLGVEIVPDETQWVGIDAEIVQGESPKKTRSIPLPVGILLGPVRSSIVSRVGWYTFRSRAKPICGDYSVSHLVSILLSPRKRHRSTLNAKEK